MRDVFEYAKYYMKSGLIEYPNTFDGNMKLQKLLFFTNFISLALNNKKMFNEKILAYDNGCVIEKVRLRYKDDYFGFKEESDRYNPEFNDEEYQILNLVNNIFGNVSAKELSNINHQFVFWKKANEHSSITGSFREKDNAIIDERDIKKEIYKINDIINAHNSLSTCGQEHEVVNGVTFYYKKGEVDLKDGILEKLEEFSHTCDDNAYSVYYDNNMSVIY